MSVDDVVNGTADDSRKQPGYHFDRHTPEYRLQFEKITEEMQAKCPMAWSETYNGHWVAAGSKQVFELARCPVVSNHHDISGETPFQGITIPKASRATVVRGGILEMDEPEHSTYRGALNPYLSPAAIKRWEPFIDEITRAALDEHIESGRIDFVDHLANVVPAVFTLAMMGIELKKWNVYSEPTHASVYTPEHCSRTGEDQRAAPRDGHRPHHQHDGDPRAPAARTGQRPAAVAHRRRPRARHRDPRQPRADHRRRLRHHHRTHRARTGVARRASRRTRAPQPRTRHAAAPRHRGVPAVLHSRARRRPNLRRGRRGRRHAVQEVRTAVAVVGDGQPRPDGLRRTQRGRHWTGRATATSVSGSVCTGVSGPTSRAPCSSPCSPRCSTACRTTSATPRAPCTTTRSASSRACGICPRPSPPATGSAPDWTRRWRNCSASATSRNSRGPITERKEAAVID